MKKKIIILTLIPLFLFTSCGKKKNSESIEESDEHGTEYIDPEDNRKVVTLKFYDEEDVFASITGKEGDELVFNKRPAKDGYIFNGWKYEHSLNTNVLPDYFPGRSINYYASWEQKRFWLNFRNHSEYNRFYNYGETLEPLKVESGKTFVGWRLDKYEGDPINKVFDLGSNLEMFFLDPVISDYTFDIHFHPTEEVPNVPNDIKNATIFTKLDKIQDGVVEGYYQYGWSISVDALLEDVETLAAGESLSSLPYSTLQTFEDDYVLDDQIVDLYPVVKKENYLINYYDFNGELIDYEYLDYGDDLWDEDDYLSISPNHDQVGSFLGWSLTPGGDIFSNQSASLISKCLDFGNNQDEVNLYAICKGHEFKVRFIVGGDVNWNSSSSSTYKDNVLSYRVGASLPGKDDLVYPSSLTFLGWESARFISGTAPITKMVNLHDVYSSSYELNEDTVTNLSPVFSAEAVEFNINYNPSSYGMLTGTPYSFSEIVISDYRLPKVDANEAVMVKFNANDDLPTNGRYGIAAPGYRLEGWIIKKIDRAVKPSAKTYITENDVSKAFTKAPSLNELKNRCGELKNNEVYALIPNFVAQTIEVPIFEKLMVSGSVKKIGTYRQKYGTAPFDAKIYDLDDEIRDNRGYLFVTSQNQYITRMYATAYNMVTGAMIEDRDEIYFAFTESRGVEASYNRFLYVNEFVYGAKSEHLWQISRFQLDENYVRA